MNERLALLGGEPVRRARLPAYNTIGQEEADAAVEVIRTGVLSGFLGTASSEFLGGPKVRQLEEAWQDHFSVPFAVSMNSATSCLYAAVAASGVGPGDEVIVSPYTMSASAAGALVYNAIPVFADIDPETFNLTAATIEARLTQRTRAIVVVDIFGQPAEMDAIMALAEARGILVIEDAAQAPGASYRGRPAGTLGHIGVFSLNRHKTIQAGEGGVAVTRDPDLAERLRLVRNHAEAVVEGIGRADIVDMLGFNYRMTEVEAAISLVQLGKLSRLHRARVETADRLTRRLAGLPGLTPPVVRPDVVHGYYVYPLRYDRAASGSDVPRSRIAAALAAEGVPVGEGYVKPLYLQPVYQRKELYGKVGCPFSCPFYEGKSDYGKGLCPVAERSHESEVLVADVVHGGYTERDQDDVARAFEKVFTQLDRLAG